jgi:hypothetical protein
VRAVQAAAAELSGAEAPRTQAPTG